MSRPSEAVTSAGELGESACCRQSWRPGQVKGLARTNAAPLAQGCLLYGQGRRARLRRLALSGPLAGSPVLTEGIIVLSVAAGVGA